MQVPARPHTPSRSAGRGDSRGGTEDSGSCALTPHHGGPPSFRSAASSSSRQSPHPGPRGAAAPRPVPAATTAHPCAAQQATSGALGGLLTHGRATIPPLAYDTPPTPSCGALGPARHGDRLPRQDGPGGVRATRRRLRRQRRVGVPHHGRRSRAPSWTPWRRAGARAQGHGAGRLERREAHVRFREIAHLAEPAAPRKVAHRRRRLHATRMPPWHHSVTSSGAGADPREEIAASPYFRTPTWPRRPPAQRKWGMRDIAALWISMSACMPTYMLASSLIDEGMNWWQAVLTIFLGN